MERISTQDLIEYLINSLRYLSRKEMILFAQMLLEQTDDYYLSEMSCCDLENLIIDCMKRVNRDAIVSCAKRYIPSALNLERCSACKKFMDTERAQSTCGHTIHATCFIRGECPACISHILDTCKPKARL